MTNPTTHIAGMPITINDQLQRQRCGWCGAILIDYDLARIAVPIGQEGPLATWGIGDVVRIDGNATYVVEHVDGEQLPQDSCTRRNAAASMIASIESEVHP